MYLIDLVEFQYWTLICALYVFESNSEYGTIRQLSTLVFNVIDLTPFLVHRRRKIGLFQL